MQKPFARPRERRRLQKRSSFRPRQRGLLLSSASKIERSRRQCRNGARKTRFSRLRILRAVGKRNHRRNKRTLSTSRNSFGRRVRNVILFVRNHRNKTKRQGRLCGNRHIQKCRKNLRKAQRARGVRRRKRVRRARSKRLCGRNRVRFFAVCNGRIHSDFEERRSVDFGISVRESPRSTEKSVIRKRTRRRNRTSRKFARTCRQKGNIIFV